MHSFNENDAAYFRMRELQERDAAARAPDESIAKIHLNLANKYCRLADDAEVQRDEAP